MTNSSWYISFLTFKYLCLIFFFNQICTRSSKSNQNPDNFIKNSNSKHVSEIVIIIFLQLYFRRLFLLLYLHAINLLKKLFFLAFLILALELAKEKKNLNMKHDFLILYLRPKRNMYLQRKKKTASFKNVSATSQKDWQTDRQWDMYVSMYYIEDKTTKLGNNIKFVYTKK